MASTSFRYLGARNRESAGSIHLPTAVERPVPVVVFAHGFKGFQDWGFFPPLCDAFAERGYAAVRFNFSHNGCSPEGREEDDLKAFQENRLSFEVIDLSLMLEQLRTSAVPGAELLDSDRMLIVGHSRGGSAVLQCAGEEGVCGLGLLASISRYPRVGEDERLAWMKAGAHYVENARTKTRLPLGLGLLAELVGEPTLLERMAKAVRVPACIIHGEKDATVLPTAARELHSWIAHSELHLLESGDHTFGARHPFAGWTPDLESTRDRLLAFAERLFARP